MSKSNSGFTLIEVMIALAIMTIAFTSIFQIQSDSSKAIRQSKETNLVTMLLKNYMIDTEHEFEGRAFTEVSKEKVSKCQEPYEEYQCSRVIKEIKFPQLSFGQNSTDPEQAQSNQMIERVTKLITKFLTQAIREVTVTVAWGSKYEYKVSLSTYWVNLNQEFSINE
ncbi:MAG: type II secretion system protein [Xanthomonadaceae bacterium]|nr:type II secretion system protein [Xanthomonadaceae bacterium]